MIRKLKGYTIVVGDIHGNPMSMLHYRGDILSQDDEVKNIILLGDIGFGFLHTKLRPKFGGLAATLDAVSDLQDIGDKEVTFFTDCIKKSSRYLVRDIMYTARLLTGNKDVKVWAIRGNHDNPDYWKETEYLQPYAKYGEKNFHFLDDGFIEINKKLWLVLGGSVSIDKETAQRLPGVSWWAGEEMNHDFNEPLPEGYKKVTGILSHTGMTPEYATWKLPEEHEGYVKEALEREIKTLNRIGSTYSPTYWFYGHFHQNWTRNIAGKLVFVCVGAGAVRSLSRLALENLLRLP